MESTENESGNNNNGKDGTISVGELQAALFPPPTLKSSFFANFIIKQPLNPMDDEDDDCETQETTIESLRLRDTSSLFALNRESNFTPQPARWPTECQVLETRITHLQHQPPNPESYYVPTGREPQPKPTGEECGIIVYQYTPISAVNYFSRSSVGGSRYLLPACLCPEEDTLRFESRFESGNLERAIRITPSFYELYLRADMYTNRHMQWFYFKVTNMKKNFLYRFSIVNFSKDDSLYNEGMRPLMYSTKDAQINSIGWRRCGENITYYSNDNVTPEDPDALMSYTLSFTTDFPHKDDEVYIANCYPYTYTDLEDYLTELSNHPVKSTFATVRLLCKSLAGNNVHYITITSPPQPGELKRKRCVVLTARVHPGETPASWIMKGILDFLTSDFGSAKELRDRFIFKLVPMLNPDGVIVGNNRCSLSAKDLNRQYRTVMRSAYPSIWYTKLMVRRLLEECGVAMYCDLHAHSRRHNIFIYGCENRRGGDRKLQEQVFPLMLHKNTADKFSFESCKFRIQKAKEGTGRVVMWMMGISNSYTMEASFAGSTIGTRAETHFSVQDLEQMGKSFCQTLLDFYDEDPRKEKLRTKIINRLVKEGSNADEPTNIQLSDYSSDEGDTSSSTSSNEAGGHDDEEEIVFVPVVPPPSPISKKGSRTKTNKANNRNRPKKNAKKSPKITRKPLPLCKTTLALVDKSPAASGESEGSSDSDEEGKATGKIVTRRKCKKKRSKAPRKKQEPCYYSDCEIQYTGIRSVSVCNLVAPAPDKLRATPANNHPAKRSKTPQSGSETRKNVITQQLAQVQAKLIILMKNKLWFGCDGDEPTAPLSWGKSNFSNPLDPPPQSPTKCDHKKKPKKSNEGNKRREREKGDANKKLQVKVREKELKLNLKPAQKSGNPKKKFGRQSAVEWGGRDAKIKKSKSLPVQTKLSCPLGDSSSKTRITNGPSGDDERDVDDDSPEDDDDDENRIGVKKKTSGRMLKNRKFLNKAKTVTNAKLFYR